MFRGLFESFIPITKVQVLEPGEAKNKTWVGWFNLIKSTGFEGKWGGWRIFIRFFFLKIVVNKQRRCYHYKSESEILKQTQSITVTRGVWYVQREPSLNAEVVSYRIICSGLTVGRTGRALYNMNLFQPRERRGRRRRSENKTPEFNSSRCLWVCQSCCGKTPSDSNCGKPTFEILN